MITKIIQEHKKSFFDKINNYLIVSSIKEILKGRDPEESLLDSLKADMNQPKSTARNRQLKKCKTEKLKSKNGYAQK